MQRLFHVPLESAALFCCLLALSSFVSPCAALTFTWTGDANTNDWDDVDFGFPSTSNWVTGFTTDQFPDANDTAVFNTTSAGGSIIVNLNGTRSIISATFQGSAPVTLNQSQLRLTSGDLTVSGTSSSYNINSSVLLQSSALWNIVSGGARLNVSGVVSGTPGLTKTGSGTLVLSGNNTYLGSTIVSGGTLQIGNGGTTGSIAGNLTSNATTIFNRASPLTYSGFINGNGALRKQGAGTLTLTANSSFSGTTTVTSGTLQLGNGGGSGQINSNIVNSGAVVFNRSNSFTYSRAISGSGSVTKLGGGTLILTGVNTYSGNTTVSNGTLQIGSGGPSGSIVADISNSANVRFNRSNNLSYGGVISGTGTLEKSGGGTLTLTNENTKVGQNTINAGTLQIGDGGTTGSLGGNFTNNAELAFNRSDEFLELSTIIGSGSVTQLGSGVLRLGGNNNYNGATNLNDGVVQFANVTNLGNASAEVVAQGGGLQYSGPGLATGVRNFVLTNDLTFEIAQASGVYNLTGNISGAGALTKTGPGSLTISGDDGGVDKTVQSGLLTLAGNSPVGGNLVNDGAVNFDRTDDLNFAGTISGAGDLVKSSGVKLTLSGANTYAGTTTINAGTVEISDDSNLGSGGSVTMADSTALRVIGTTSAARNFQLDGTTAEFDVDTAQVYTIDGAISSATSSLVKSGDGTLALNGANTYAGGTTVQAGTLELAFATSGGLGPIDIQAGTVQVNNDAFIGVSGFLAPSSITIANGATFSTNADSETTIGPLAFVALNGGAIETNRLKLQFGAELDGSGSVSARVLADTGSTIAADANLSLGDASSVSGFYSNGDMETNDNTITLLDANDAVFDSGATIDLGVAGTGEVDAANGLTLDFGANVTGFGTINTPNSDTTPVINNGNITGVSMTDRVTLTGYVKGVGTCDFCNITGTDAPGFSPATVNRGSVSYNGTLEIEIGGTSEGDFDQLNHVLGAGVADLGGTLDVDLIDGFSPSVGDSFEIINAASIVDTFDVEDLPDIGGLLWDVTYNPTSVVLSVLTPHSADFDLDGDVDSDDLAQWQGDYGANGDSDADGDGDSDGADFLAWQRQFGSGVDPVAASQIVPEPSDVVLCVCLLIICTPTRWRG